MFWKSLGLGLVASLFGLWIAGCKREPGGNQVPGNVPPAQIIGQVHWLGKKRLSTETNAAYLMDIWGRSQSARLETQTLDKLSTAPWRLLLKESGSNSASGLLRPLLEDIVQEESYLEVRRRSNGEPEVTFAIHLTEARSLLWKTNLAAVLESLTRIQPVRAKDGKGWSLKKHHAPNYFQLDRAGEWTILGLADDDNAALRALSAQIRQRGTPSAAAATNFWLVADWDIAGFFEAFPRLGIQAADAPHISLALVGDGSNVRTHGSLTFQKSLDLRLEPWVVPTNTIREPLISFTAMQAIMRLWQEVPRLSSLKVDYVPNQLYVWALGRTPFLSFIACPIPNATNWLRNAGPQIAERFNEKLPPKGGSVVLAANGYSLVWTGVPFATPYLTPISDSGNEFLFGGLFPNTLLTNRPPPELLGQVYPRTNLVYYDWEVTQERLIQWRYLDDLTHIAIGPNHKPNLRTESTSVQWLGNISTNLGNSVTEITFVDNNRLGLERKSTLGLTGCELEWLANWLESREFPTLPISDSRVVTEAKPALQK